MPESAWTKMTRPSTPDERKLTLFAVVLLVCTAWVYFRVAHHLPVVVDMLFPLWYFPAMHLVLRSAQRKLGLKARRWSDIMDGQAEPHWRDSAFNRQGLFASIFVLCLAWWIGINHTGRFPVEVAVVLFIIGVLGTFVVPCVNALAGVLRSRRAGRSL